MDFYTAVFLATSILSMILIIISIVEGKDDITEMMFGTFIISIIFLVLRLCIIFGFENNNYTYYLEAVKYSQNEQEVLFVTDQGYYNWKSESGEEYYSNGNYLLTMTSNGTKDTDDDTILIVWEAKQPNVEKI